MSTIRKNEWGKIHSREAESVLVMDQKPNSLDAVKSFGNDETFEYRTRLASQPEGIAKQKG